MRYTLVDSNGIVVNVIKWDGKASYTPPEGTSLHKIPAGEELKFVVGEKITSSLIKEL